VEYKNNKCIEESKNMNCHFDLCEFINVVVGGIVTGLVASLLWAWFSELFRNFRYSMKYKYLKSPIGIEDDWICYSMKKENGRIREDKPNGSTVTIPYEKGNNFTIKLKQNDDRIWIGKLKIVDENIGSLHFRYKNENEHEYGFKDVFIGEEIENGKKYDVLFLIGKGKDYGNEIFLREKNR
jgi:hypothetical protein